MSAIGGQVRNGARAARSVIQVTLWNSPYLGNFMVSELALAGHVRERFGLHTHFVLADGAAGQPWLADLDEAGVSWSILSPDPSTWRSALEARVREQHGVLLHAHFTKADLQSAAAASSAGIPCVWHIRTGFNGYPLKKRATDLVKMRIVARRRVARVVAVSPWLGELARRRGMPTDRISVVQNAIMFDRFAQLPDRAEARARLALDPDAEVVLGLGWWPDVKGVDVLIDAVTPIAEERPSLQVLLVGEEAMRAFLSQRLPQLPPWLRVSGFVSDPAWLYASADVFVSASRHEGQSGAVGEALASGLPVVMSDIGGHEAWRSAPGTLTFPNEDVGALRERLRELLDSRERRAQAGSANRAWAERFAGVDRWSEGMCAVYEPLLAPESPGHAPSHRATQV